MIKRLIVTLTALVMVLAVQGCAIAEETTEKTTQTTEWQMRDRILDERILRSYLVTPEETKYVTTDFVPVKRFPLYDSEAIEIMSKDKKLTIVGWKDDNYVVARVGDNNDIGFIESQYLSDHVVYDEVPEVSKYISIDSVPLKSYPDYYGEITEVLNRDEEVTLVGIKNDEYSVVRHNDTVSFVETKYLEDTPSRVYLGTFQITHYCPGACCNGTSSRLTASGAYLEDGVSIAVDPRLIPLGSHVYIEGYGDRIAQDTGGAIKGQHIDMFVDAPHSTVENMGVVYRDVYVYNR